MSVRIKPLTLPLIGAALVLLVYLGFHHSMSHHFSGDSLMHAHEIRERSLSEMAQRHRLLMNVSAWAFVSVRAPQADTLTWLRELQIFNALAGALAVGLMFGMLRQQSGRAGPALVAAGGLGFSHAAWLFSTDAEMVMPAIATMIAGLWIAMHIATHEDVGWPSFVASVLLSAFAFLLYAQSALLLLVMVAANLLAPDRPRFDRAWCASAYLLATVALVAAVYAGHAALTPGTLSGALYGGQGLGTVYGTLSPSALPYGAYALLRSIANYPGLGPALRSREFLAAADSATTIRFALFYGVIALVVTSPVLIAGLRWRRFSRTLRCQLGLLALWALLNGLFALYWVPRDLQFWLPVTVSWWILVGLMLAFLQAERYGPAVLSFSAALVVTLGWLNYVGAIEPRRHVSTNRAIEIARSIPDNTRETDLVISVDDDRYAQYFSEREWLSLYVLALEHPFPPDEQARALLRDRVSSEMKRAWAEGGRVYLREPDPRDVHTMGVASTIGWPSVSKGWPMRVAWSVGGATMVEILPHDADAEAESDAADQRGQP